MKLLCVKDFSLSKQFCPQQNSKLSVSIKILSFSIAHYQKASAWLTASELWDLETPKPYQWVPARGKRKISCLESKERQQEIWFMGTQVSKALRLLGVLSGPSHTGGKGYCFPRFSYLSIPSCI